ncbi:MAG: hypothetical protein R3Y09_11705 [Clostridia bacterium]
MIVNGDLQYLGQMREETKKLHRQAEARNVLYHYTKAESAVKILRDERLLLKCMEKYIGESKYEREDVGEFDKWFFISSFTTDEYLDNEEEMWEEFADEATGVRIKFSEKKDLYKKCLKKTNQQLGA